MAQVMLKGGPFDGEAVNWTGGSTIEKPVVGRDPLAIGAPAAASTPDDAMIAIYRQDVGNRRVFGYQGIEHAAGGGASAPALSNLASSSDPSGGEMKKAAAHIGGLFGSDAVHEALRRAQWVQREEGDEAARRYIGAAILLCRHETLVER